MIITRFFSFVNTFFFLFSNGDWAHGEGRAFLQKFPFSMRFSLPILLRQRQWVNATSAPTRKRENVRAFSGDIFHFHNINVVYRNLKEVISAIVAELS